MNASSNDLGQRMTELRKERGWSMNRLAREMQVSKETIRNLERGIYSPKFDTLHKLAAALEVEVGELLKPGQGAA